ncbi:MAG TPA: hypothetical protein VI078_03700 [bacterium]
MAHVQLKALASALAIASLLVLPRPGAAAGAAASGSDTGDEYVVVGWNDLGMHCINPSYKTLALLPPFNNLWVQVVKRGEPPQLVTSGVTLTYSIANNTTVKGKSDFWQYAPQLFGVNLPEGIGLTGNGLSGEMKLVGDHFEATGIPVLPRNDDMTWNPYQSALVKLAAADGATRWTKVVLPVSDEIHCEMCHMQGGDGTTHLPVDPMNGLTGTMDVDLNILMTHDYYQGQSGVAGIGQNLVGAEPVLCAKCHSSNALQAPGVPGVKSVSLAMHGWHNGVDRAADGTCYSCHPGADTRCLRTRIGGMGYEGDVPACQDGACHGGIAGMGDPTREPWATEPTCEQCHGKNYTTGGALYRRSTGHGGLACAFCHNSPHAWYPSKRAADNLQPARLQGAGTSLGRCSICHTRKLEGDNPHVTYLPTYGKAQQPVR